MSKYNLICMAPDGDHVTAGSGFDTVQDAWEESANMGSRWFFYPIHVVTTDTGLTVADAPILMEWANGKRVRTVKRTLAKFAAIDPESQYDDMYIYLSELAAWREWEHAQTRLRYLRRELRAERISWGELAELQALAPFIQPGDVELLEAAGVPEFPEEVQA